MKVLVPIPAPVWGGIHSFVSTLAPAMKSQGVHWIAALPDTISADPVEQRLSRVMPVQRVQLSRIQRDFRASAAAVWNLRTEVSLLAGLIRELDIDVVQSAGVHHVVPALAAKVAGVPLVVQFHSDLVPAPIRQVAGWLFWRYASAVMINGEPDGSSRFGIPRSKAGTVIAFGPPLDFAQWGGKMVEGQRKELLHLQDGAELVIGTVGNQGWQKGHDRLARIAFDLKCRLGSLEGVCFRIVGQQIASQAAWYKEEVTDWARLNGLTEAEFSVIEPVCPINRYMSALNLFVLTSRSEGVPIVVAEALASGLPIVSFDVGRIRDIWPSEGNWLVKAHSLDCFVDALSEAISDARTLSEVGSRNRHSSNDRFSVETVVKAHQRAYELAGVVSSNG